MSISDALSLGLDRSHDTARRSFVGSANGHPDFPIQNLPFGVYIASDGVQRSGVRIGDSILDLGMLAASSFVPQDVRLALGVAAIAPLNGFFALGRAARQSVRLFLSDLLSESSPDREAIEPMLIPADAVEMALPLQIGDYTDFYAGIQHALNVGGLLRPDNPLLPNYKYVPIGYHGRASSIRPSGAPVRRPQGQTRPVPGAPPAYGPSRRLDYELELGAWVCGGNALGEPIPVGTALDHIGGYCLLNDWSARDIQAWEYQPLGPFLSKSFASTISPWIVTCEAMAPFRVAQQQRVKGDPDPLPYLLDKADQDAGALDLEISVLLRTRRMRDAGAAPHRLSRGTARDMYWTFAQLLAHHASNGCDLRTGDLLGSGTISGVEPTSFGSLMEISLNGTAAITLDNGETRTFLEDGDEIILRARTETSTARVGIGFGDCSGVIVPA